MIADSGPGEAVRSCGPEHGSAGGEGEKVRQHQMFLCCLLLGFTEGTQENLKKRIDSLRGRVFFFLRHHLTL